MSNPPRQRKLRKATDAGSSCCGPPCVKKDRGRSADGNLSQLGQDQQSKPGLNHAPSVCSSIISAQKPCVLRKGEPIPAVATIKRSSKSFALSKRSSKS